MYMAGLILVVRSQIAIPKLMELSLPAFISVCWWLFSSIDKHTGAAQRRYEIISIPREFCAYQCASSWTCLHTVAVLKLKNCGIPKGSLAQTL